MSAPQAMTLPPLRNGITIAFNDYDIEGKPQWLIHDPANNKFILVGWLEYEILSRWHQAEPAAIIDSIRRETTLQVEMTDIEYLYKFLLGHFLLRQTGYQILGQAKEQNIFKDESVIAWLIEHYLFFRIPLCRPDSFLVRTAVLGRILFSRYTALIMMALGCVALYQLGQRWPEFTHTFSTVFNLQSMFLYMIGFTVAKLLHEFGHAYMCRSYGIPVPTLGVAFLVFWPVLYTDTTLSWSLTSKQRLRIALAGMWAETYTVIIAALIWCNTNILALKSITYLMISVNWVASLLINVSPFMRFDGYYVLADLLRMPNLQPRAFALTRWQIRRMLFAWPDPPPEKFGWRLHWFLVTYSIITWLYRLVLYVGIAVMVYHFFIKLGGIILFVIELYYFILGPFYREFLFWLANRQKISLNINTQITFLFVIVAAVLCIVPFNRTLSVPATISYFHQVIYTPEAGILEKSLPPSGTMLKKGDVIAVLNSPWVDEALKQVIAEYREKMNELRRAQVNPKFSAQQEILLSDISKQNSEYNKLYQRRSKLVLYAPFNGRLADVSGQIPPGTTLQKNEWLADLVKTDQFQIEGYVTETERSRIQPGQTGQFYSTDPGMPPITVKVKSIEILNAKELNCHVIYAAKGKKKGGDPPLEPPCYHINEFGGDIPVFQTETGSYVPVESVYLITFATANQPSALRQIERGTIRLQADSRSYVIRLWKWVNKTLIEQSGF